MLIYLPHSLIKRYGLTTKREDYWGVVGRLAFRWPEKSQGLRVRGGLELGLAPETPTTKAYDTPGDHKDASGLAWNVVVSAMDIYPGHNLGFNYGHTEAGWLLSPQFTPNTQLFEIRYQWRSVDHPLIEARVRRQENLDTQSTIYLEGDKYDFYLRLTWEYGG